MYDKNLFFFGQEKKIKWAHKVTLNNNFQLQFDRYIKSNLANPNSKCLFDSYITFESKFDSYIIKKSLTYT